MNQSNKQGQPARVKHGFSLIEAAIILGIVGLVIGGIWVAASAVQENLRINRAVSDTGVIANNLRSLFKGHGLSTFGQVYDSRINVNLNSRAFPADALSGNTPINPWGQQNGYVATIHLAAEATRIYMTVYVPDVSACAKLVMRMYGAYKDELDLSPHTGMVIGLDIGTDEGGDGYISGFPSPTNAVYDCQDAEANGNLPLYVNIEFRL